jgi:hypothetical protein
MHGAMKRGGCELERGRFGSDQILGEKLRGNGSEGPKGQLLWPFEGIQVSSTCDRTAKSSACVSALDRSRQASMPLQSRALYYTGSCALPCFELDGYPKHAWRTPPAFWTRSLGGLPWYPDDLSRLSRLRAVAFMNLSLASSLQSCRFPLLPVDLGSQSVAPRG